MYIFNSSNGVSPYDISNSDESYVMQNNEIFDQNEPVREYNKLVLSRFKKEITHDEFMTKIQYFKFNLSHDELAKVKKRSSDLKYKEENPERVKNKLKRYQEAHRNELKEYKREYYKLHKEEADDRNKRYCETHKKEIQEYKSNYRKQNKDRIKNYEHNHRDSINASKRKRHRIRMNELIYSDRFKGVCAICGCKVDINTTNRYPEFHHIRYKNKRYNISDLIAGYKPIELINEELELGKVILVCHSCHLKESAWQGRLEKRTVTEDEQLQFVKLRDDYGMSYSEIADKFGVSRSTVLKSIDNYHKYHDIDVESKNKADSLVYYSS